MSNNHFLTTCYAKLSTKDSLNGGWQLDGNDFGPSGQSLSFPSAGVFIKPISPAQVLTLSTGTTVNLNAVVEILPTGLRVNSQLYGSVDTIAVLNTAAT